MDTKQSTSRFSNRVADYIKYRPHYPQEVITYLQDVHHIHKDFLIADIGAGTGISSKLFIDNDYHVFGVEPNDAMRGAAIELLADTNKFSTTNGTAENTLLEDDQIDVIIAAQAFHWFDRDKVRKEFKRILKDNGLVVLMWNERLIESEFGKSYEDLIKNFASDYEQIDHKNINDKVIESFFAPELVDLKLIPNHQIFDFDGLKGRLMSSSYMPTASHPRFEEMINSLRQLYDQYQNDNQITIHYEVKVYVSKIS